MTCCVPGCANKVKNRARQLCSKHYERLRLYGDVNHTNGSTPYGAAQSFYEARVLGCTTDDCLIWPYSRQGGGYGSICRHGKWRTVASLVCEDLYGQPPTPQHEAAHSCGNGHLGCVNPRHLRWATHSENLADRVEHGTANRGERHGNAKITRHDVRAIRMMAGKRSQREIAEALGTTRNIVQRVIYGETWAWLD